MFAQDPSESAFLFDLRLRESLSNPAQLKALSNAVLVCTTDLSDREILRRLRLVAARVKPGGKVTLTYNQPTVSTLDLGFGRRLEQLAQFAGSALLAHRVAVDVLPVSQLAQQSAPLSAAWHRLQRHRTGSVPPPSGSSASDAQQSPPALSTVQHTVVCRTRKTQTTRLEWAQGSTCATPTALPAFAVTAE